SSTRLGRVELTGERKPTAVVQPAGKEYYDFGQVSPDGRWIVYTSRESGHGEIYVASYPSLSTKYQIWNDVASPLWRDDGREILFMAARGAVMSVKVQRAGDGLTFSPPELLFNSGHFTVTHDGVYYGFAVTSDAQRFIILL